MKWTGSESQIETLDSNDINNIRQVLDELGVSLSDVFGADRILWVEGPTEAICFPCLLRHAGKPLTATTNVVAMINTGDFEGRRARHSLTWEIYERLTNGSMLIPPALAFSFDREGRTNTEIEDMSRQARGTAHFLPRRTYENFLLDADAISAVLNENGIATSPGCVEAWISEQGARREYFTTGTIAADDPRWLNVVNAPKLLDDLFKELSADAPIYYRKVVHSVALTDWLIVNKPEALNELVEYVVNLTNKPNDTAKSAKVE
jgi:hypothetical protein